MSDACKLKVQHMLQKERYLVGTGRDYFHPSTYKVNKDAKWCTVREEAGLRHSPVWWRGERRNWWNGVPRRSRLKIVSMPIKSVTHSTLATVFSSLVADSRVGETKPRRQGSALFWQQDYLISSPDFFLLWRGTALAPQFANLKNAYATMQVCFQFSLFLGSESKRFAFN